MVIDRNISLAQDSSSGCRPVPDSTGFRASAARIRARAPRVSASRCPGSDYCPSHKHLEETYDGPGFPLEALERELATEELRAAA